MSQPNTKHSSAEHLGKKVWSLLSPARRRQTILLWLLMLVGTLLEMLGVGMVIPFIALLTQPDLQTHYPWLKNLFAPLGNTDRTTLISAMMGILVAVYLVKNLFLAFLAWIQNRFAFGLQAELSQKLFAIYLQQPYTFHLQRNSAQLIRNVQAEVGMFIGKGIGPLINLSSEGMVLAGLSLMLLLIEPAGTAVTALIIGIATLWFHRLTRKRISRWGQDRQHHETKRQQHLQQGLGGSKDIKLLGREKQFLASYNQHTRQSLQASQLQATLQSMPRLWLELLVIIALALLVLGLLAQGKAIESIVPTLGLFTASAFRLIPSLARINGAAQQLRFSRPAINTLHDEIGLASTAPATQPTTQVLPFQHAIELKNVTYSYPASSQPALSNISLSIARGQSVGFIGSSGSGKSTLADIILGLLPPASGSITVDGQPIDQNLRAWQNQIGYVPQSIYLTDDTLRNNIAFGIAPGEINEEAIWRAVRDAKLEEFISSLPDGLNTVVGERGVRLSGGQRQRIGIARALYHNPAVLVLDEATSALDMETESHVMDAILALQGTKTLILIAHRLSTLRNCDQVFKITAGRLDSTSL